jgi:hypothetical protein
MAIPSKAQIEMISDANLNLKDTLERLDRIAEVSRAIADIDDPETADPDAVMITIDSPVSNARVSVWVSKATALPLIMREAERVRAEADRHVAELARLAQELMES